MSAVSPAALLLAAVLSLAMLTVVSAAQADGAASAVSAATDSSSSQASRGNSADAPAGDDAKLPGQTLEIPAATPPSASAPSDGSSDSTWSDGTHTYMWKDENEYSGDEDAAAMPAPDGSIPEPLYGSADEYVNQSMEAEALGPAFPPFFGASMPLLMTPYMYAPYSSYPVPVAPAPAPMPHHHGHFVGLDEPGSTQENAAKAPPRVEMGGIGHAPHVH